MQFNQFDLIYKRVYSSPKRTVLTTSDQGKFQFNLPHFTDSRKRKIRLPILMSRNRVALNLPIARTFKKIYKYYSQEGCSIKYVASSKYEFRIIRWKLTGGFLITARHGIPKRLLVNSSIQAKFWSQPFKSDTVLILPRYSWTQFSNELHSLGGMASN